TLISFIYFSMTPSMAVTSKSITLYIITHLCLVSWVLSQQQETEFLHHGFLKANILNYGSTKILPSGILELTNTSRRQMGQAFHGFPIPFTNPNSSNPFSFSTSFVFSINAPGHGLTFMISPSMDFTRAMASQFLGLFNASNNGNSTNRILAVEFDTVKSNEFLDIDGNHVGIDVNDPIRAWIEYDGEEMVLNVTLAPLDISKPKLPLMSRKMNLTEIFNDKMFVGFSASTGNMTSNHYVLGWSFSREGKAKEFDLTLLPSVSAPSPSELDDFDLISDTPSDSATANAKGTKLIIICKLVIMFFMM
ncbi:hypothetical protein HID58_031173, partial [Brassica napus]